MPEATFATLGLVENFDLFPYGLFVSGYYHLANSLAVFYNKIVRREIYEYYTYLATIVGIDSAGRIKHGYALLDSQATPGTYLSLVSLRQGNEKTRRHQYSSEWFEGYRRVEIGTYI